jgi:AcrR family transcriptional regulator
MTPARRTQRERRTEAERRLVEAAAELVAESGPAGVTLARVGERAGFSRGLVAHHFGSKAALMERVADTVTGEFDAALQARLAPGGTVGDDLRTLVDVYLDVVADPPAVNRARLVLIADAVAHEGSDARAAVLGADRLFRRRLGDRFERAAADGELPPGTDAGGLATAVAGMLRGVAFASMLDPTVDLEAACKEISALLSARL